MRYVIFLALFLVTTSASAMMITVKWDYSPEDTPFIDGFKLYYGQTSHASVVRPPGDGKEPYDLMVTILDPTMREVKLNVALGMTYFRLVAYKRDILSNFSGETAYEVALPAPGDPKVAMDNVIIAIGSVTMDEATKKAIQDVILAPNKK